MAKSISKSEVTFTYTYELDHADPSGYFDDEEMLAWVREQIKADNVAAWMDVCVTAEWNGMKANAYLGGCSYESLSDFEESDEYSDLQHQAYEELNAMAAKIVDKLA